MMSKLVLVVFFIAIGVFPVSGVVKIMPLGDSITENDQWRYALCQLLRKNGLMEKVDLVGSKPMGRGGDWDKGSEGHSGWLATEILKGCRREPAAGNLHDWAPAATPDVVLIHLATNDVWRNAGTTSSIISTLGQIIDVLRTANPQVKIIIAQIIPSTKFYAGALNQQIPKLAYEKSTASSPIFVADMTRGFDPSVDCYDGAHPNDQGGQKMAAAWLRQVKYLVDPALPDTDPPYLIDALTPAGANTVNAYFDSPLDPTSAQDPAHYALDHDVTVSRALLEPGGKIVTLATSRLSPWIEYSLSVSEKVKDPAGNPVPPREHISFTYAAGNLVENPSFEIGIPENTIYGWSGPSVEIDPKNAHSGKRCIRITGGKTSYIGQAPILDPGTAYTLSFWVKTDGVSGNNGVAARFIELAPTQIFHPTAWASGTADWRPLRTSFSTAGDFATGRLDLLWDHTAGTAWLDDVSLTPDKK